MLALDAWRIVADPGAIDRVAWTSIGDRSVTLLRMAPDEILAIDADRPEVDDAHAIVERESGYVGSWGWSLADVRRHTEWPIPVERPVIAQGLIAGVPARLWLRDDDHVLVVTAATYADVLGERLGRR